MIVNQEIDGRPATVCYFKGQFIPCDKAEAEFAKVSFEDVDNGAIILILKE